MFYSGGLDFVSPVVMANTTFQAQLVFQNLSSVLSGSSGICTECPSEIVILIHTVLINEVGNRNSLVNATGRYAGLTVMVRVDMYSICRTSLSKCVPWLVVFKGLCHIYNAVPYLYSLSTATTM